MASNKYFYQVLGVQSNASQDEIKQAFHQLAHKYHPDISTEPNAAQKFQDINEAYTALRNQKTVDKKRSKLPIIAAVTGITSLVAIIIFFYQNSFNTQEIQAGILKSNLEAIQSLENANINFAKKVISGTGVKVALIDFYLKNPPLWKKLDAYHDSIRAEILKDDQVYRRLRDHYYHQIDNEIKEDKFKKALPLLGEIKKAYPDKSELYSKYQQMQEKKQQRLAALTQKYMDCLYKTWMPLLERTHCMAAARNTIKTVGIEHELPTDANLPAMYAKEVRLALKDQNYDHADDILLDWEKLLPANSGQRDVLKDILYLRRERENIVADLSGNDKMQVAKRLHQLSADPILQQQILEIPKVKNNISKYKFDEILTIIASNYGDISPSYESKLREILEIPEEVDPEEKTTQVASASDSSSTPIIPIAIPTLSTTEEVKNNNKTDTLLTECQRLYNKNYLTRGRKTALSCYRNVLKIEPNNNQALDGLNNIENKYYLWADSNLKKKKFSRVKYYIQSLQKFNSNSSRLTSLKEKLNAAQRQTVAQANEATKAKEAARLARLKASKERAVKEREARLKAAKERAAKRRVARYKAAKAKTAKAKTAKRKVANAKAAQQRAAKRKAANAKAAQQRAAKRKVARTKAAQQRAAKRKAAIAKAAKQRAAKRKVARAKAAQQRAAKRKAANAKAAKERAAKRKVARQKAAQQRAAKRKVARQNAIKAARIKAVRKAARRKIAKEKAANARAAKRKSARAKAAKESAARRKAARRKAANARAAKRKSARAKAAKESAARRKAARRKAANAARAAKRKSARAKAAKESAARRKAARRKAIKEKTARRLAAKKKAARRKKIAKRKRGGSCSRLVKQMSIGVKALTRGQKAYFRRNCR